MENLLGSAFNDKLTGDATGNTLTGGAGNDTLEGGAGTGTDYLIGGAGSDTYIIRQDNVRITESANGGTDTVKAAIGYTLDAANVERLYLVGKDDISAFGNSSANVIRGNTGDNSLDGRGGKDVLTGFGGSDTFVFSSEVNGANVTRITDFDGDDLFGLSGPIADGVQFENGTLLSSEFSTIDSSSKPDASAHIFYRKDKGALYYDADGYYGTASKAVLFAVIDTKLDLSASDFHSLGG